MIAYKGFNKDLTCTMGKGTYQYIENEWMEEEEANCRQNGYHSAENPLDCLSYYGDWDQSVYFQVEVEGDLDEDGNDSKISSTRIKLVRKLKLFDFVTAAVEYICMHPKRPIRERRNGRIRVEKETGRASAGGAVIVYGNTPRASGPEGSILAMVKMATEPGMIAGICIKRVDGATCKANTWYQI